MSSTLQDSIQGYLDADANNGRAHDIIAELAQPVEQALSTTGQTSNAEEQLWSLWRAFIASARQTTQNDAERQSKLANLVLAIQHRPAPTVADPSELQVQGMSVWSDLPILGWALRESWNETAKDSDSEDKRNEWVNLNAWCAVLTAKSFEQKQKQPDATLLGLWTIRDALESSDPASQTAVAAGAVWFINAATPIWDLCQAEKTFDGKIAKAGARFDDEDWRGFSKKRWNMWHTRLTDIIESDSNYEKTIQLVKAAVEAMQAAEQK